MINSCFYRLKVWRNRKYSPWHWGLSASSSAISSPGVLEGSLRAPISRAIRCYQLSDAARQIHSPPSGLLDYLWWVWWGLGHSSPKKWLADPKAQAWTVGKQALHWSYRPWTVQILFLKIRLIWFVSFWEEDSPYICASWACMPWMLCWCRLHGGVLALLYTQLDVHPNAPWLVRTLEKTPTPC